MKKAIQFGTDGWRAVMAEDFTFANVRIVAQAVADYLKHQQTAAEEGVEPTSKSEKAARALASSNKPVVVGYDYRFQSKDYATEIAKVLKGNRLAVVLLSEVLPTPAVSCLTARSKARLGIMVTASHNAATYNGIKIKVGGGAAPESLTKEIEGFLEKNQPVTEGDIPEKSFKSFYMDYLRSQFSVKSIAQKIRRPVVIDYLHGNGIGLMEALVPSKKFMTLHDRVDPLFGGLHPEPIEKNLKALSQAVVDNKAMLGLALDGDADRLSVVDEKGRFLTPCQLFPLLLRYMLETRKLKGPVLQSVSLGYLSHRVAKAYGVALEEVPVGFKHIAERMREEAVAMGGEESGGYAWQGGLPERDGLLTGLLVLEMLTKSPAALSALYSDLEKKYGKSCYVRVDLPLRKPISSRQHFTEYVAKRLPKKILGSPIVKLSTIDGVKIILNDQHWLLLRPSGTEPLVRTYAETDSREKTMALLELAEKWVHRVA
ncbi:MAG: hypothetical protein HY611_01740 [Elusimicrobia bacterium]|nr:hypothetical protein [Elusimicrobiota bacterium]